MATDKKVLTVTFDDDGSYASIYADELLGYYEAMGGAPLVRRASHVEPGRDGGWTVELASWVPALRPSNDERVFEGFPTRQAALEFEVAELRRRGL
jgi:hypothetical protein